MPQPTRPLAPFTAREQAIRGALTVLAALLLALSLNVMVVGQLRHLVAQQQLSDMFLDQLAKGTAPVSEGDVDDVLLADGAPVGIIEIPRLGIREVIVEAPTPEPRSWAPAIDATRAFPDKPVRV